MIAKVHRADGKAILAVCDSNLIGKVFEEGKRLLDIRGSFFCGEERSEKEILELFKKVDAANIVGKASVNLALKAGLIEKEHIMFVKKVPHAQMVRL